MAAVPWPAARPDLRWQVGRFAVVGALCTVLHLGLFAVLHHWWSAQVANVGALVLATVVNTALNRTWTFHATGSGAARQQVQAFGVFLLTWGATSGGLAVLDALAPQAGTAVKTLALGAATAVSTMVRFVVMRRWIFAPPRSVAVDGPDGGGGGI